MNLKKVVISIGIVSVFAVLISSFISTKPAATQAVTATIINPNINKQEILNKSQSLTDNFLKKVTEICESHSKASNKQANNIASNLSSSKKCMKIIGYLATDKIKHSNKTENYLDEHIQPEINRTISNLTDTLTQEYNKYVDSICSNLENYIINGNVDIEKTIKSGPNPSISSSTIKKDLKVTRNQLICSTINTIDTNAVIKGLVKICYNIFGSAIKYIPLSVCDGILPIMDIYAAYKIKRKIKKAKNNFRNNLYKSINNTLQCKINEINQTVENNAIFINTYLQEYINNIN